MDNSRVALLMYAAMTTSVGEILQLDAWPTVTLVFGIFDLLGGGITVTGAL